MVAVTTLPTFIAALGMDTFEMVGALASIVTVPPEVAAPVKRGPSVTAVNPILIGIPPTNARSVFPGATV